MFANRKNGPVEIAQPVAGKVLVLFDDKVFHKALFKTQAVRQEGPNHFVVDCPSHGEKRMERQGTNWRCTGQTNKQACTVVIPRSVIGRFFAG